MKNAAWVVAVLVLCAASALRAQEVRGVLIEEGTQTPIAGAIVVLQAEDGAPRARALTDGRGRFVLRAPTPGRYRVRANRIGYESQVGEAFELRAGEPRVYTMMLAAEPIELSGIDVEAERRCTVRPEEGAVLARVWEEARKALTAATLTETHRPLRYEIVSFERELDPSALEVRGEEWRRRSAVAKLPFGSVSADSLAAFGYVRQTPSGTYYYAPDAHVLLSDSFLDRHCFRLRAGAGADARLLGLAFEPAHDDGTVDVEGVLWLDLASGELRRLEYRYAGLKLGVPTDRLGGTVVFERLPSGAWIVRRWSIRTPRIEVASEPARREAARRWSNRRRRGRTRTARLVGIHEVGGVVTDVFEAGTDAILRAAEIEGVVHDSIRGVPLAGAVVRLEDTRRTAVTDSAGRFRFAGVPPGDHAVSFSHPWADSLGYAPPARRVYLAEGDAVRIRLAVPAPASLIAARCGESKGRAAGAVFGRVTDEATGAPLPGARVIVSWRDHRIGPEGAAARDWEAAATTDDTGAYLICGVPLEGETTARAVIAGRPARAGEARPLAPRLARLDFALPTPKRAAIVGRVLDYGTAGPVEAALVRLDGADDTQALTDASGRFVFADVAPGAHRLTVRHIGYEDVEASVEVAAGRRLDLTVRLAAVPIALDPIDVAVEALPGADVSGFHERRRRGFGHFITRDQILEMKAARLVDVLRGVPTLELDCLSAPDVCRPRMRRVAPSLVSDPSAAGDTCPIRYFVDGIPFDTELGLEAFHPDDIEGIEIYGGGATIPIQFGGSNARCGVIAIWTRRGGG